MRNSYVRAATRHCVERSRIETDTDGPRVGEHTVALRSPALWWPRGFGDQNRHVLRVALGEQERTTTVGICDVTVEDGSVLVNGEPIPIRGLELVSDSQRVENRYALDGRV